MCTLTGRSIRFADLRASRRDCLFPTRNGSKPPIEKSVWFSQQPSCGSTFRNPEGDHAARLIESSGLKGHCIGGACVSEKHANFIINRGDATAADIESLMEYIQQQVYSHSGVALQAEVHIVGEAA